MAAQLTVSAPKPIVRTAVAFGNQSVPTPAIDWNNGQVVTISGTSAQSSAIDTANDRLVELCCTTNSWYAIGVNPTAAKSTAGSHFIPSGQLRYVYVPAGLLIALIQDSAGGFASILPAISFI